MYNSLYMPGETSENPAPPPNQEQPTVIKSGLNKLVPTRLKGLFGRRAGENATPNSQELVAAEPGVSPIHPDIEEGARNLLEDELVKSVKIGSPVGMRLAIKELASAWERAQKAANQTFELTPEGRQELPAKVKEICEENLREGLASVYRTAAFEIKSGWEHSIKDEPKRVAELFAVAQEFQIPLTYAPEPEREQTGNLPTVLITTGEQAATYMEQVIDRNLPQGIHGIIKMAGFKVSQGSLKELPDYEKELEKWIEIMQHRGWKVVDAEPPPPVIGEEKPGLLPRQVNRAEVRQLLDQAVRDNLEKGMAGIPKSAAFLVKGGWPNPVSGARENIALYTEAAQRYGLTFDQDAISQQLKEAITENLPAGLEHIGEWHLKNVRDGYPSQIKYHEQLSDDYIALAKEYGVAIDEAKLKAQMKSHITTDNLREGVKSRIQAIRDALRKGSSLSIHVETTRADDFRRYVAEQGFDSEVDFSELDLYQTETATQSPLLTAGQN